MIDYKQKIVEVLAKLGVSKEEAVKSYEDSLLKLKDPEFAYNNAVASYNKRKKLIESGKYVEIETLIFAQSAVNDFGAEATIKRLTKEYQEGNEEAKNKLIREGKVSVADGKVVVLETGNFGKGQPLNPELKKQKTVFGFIKQDGKTMQARIKLTSTLVGEYVPEAAVVKMFGQKAATTNVLNISLSRSIKPVFKIVSKEEKLLDVCKKAAPDCFIAPDKIVEWYATNAGKVAFVEGIVASGENNWEFFLSDDNQEYTIVCRNSKNNDFVDGAKAVIVLDIYKTKEGELAYNAVNVFMDEKYKVKGIKSVANTTEEVVPTSENQEGWA